VRGYIATITREGSEARGILVDRQRRQHPTFAPILELSTIAIGVGRARRERRSRFDVEEVDRDDLDDVMRFVNLTGRKRQFFPVTSREELATGTAVFVARDRVRIVGVLRLWDQSPFKQAVVRGYAPGLRAVLPVYNAAMRLRGAPAVPSIGVPIRCVFACGICDVDADAFEVLLRRAYDRAARAGHEYLMVGFAAADPRLRIARSYAHIEYRSTLYDVRWNDTGGYLERLDDRPPYVEIATL
jgi:hypothetical protein